MTQIKGTFGLEHCSPGTACHTFCGTTCGSNFWWCSYPHFDRCNSGHCTKQTALPKPPTQNHCNGFIYFAECSAPNNFLGANILDCGPDPRTAHAAACQASKSANVVACCNPALFTSLCGGCNPMTLGIGYTTLSLV